MPSILSPRDYDRKLSELGWTSDRLAEYVGVSPRQSRNWKKNGFPRYVIVVLDLLLRLKKAEVDDASMQRLQR